MKLFLLGATGNTGREVVDLAVTRGHQVTAFVRSPDKLGRSDLTAVRGDPLDVKRVAAALAGHDAVLSTLGLPPRQALRPSTFMTETGATTIAAMKMAGVDRLCILSAAVLFAGSGLGHAFFSWFLKHHARDLAAMETIVSASDAAWTIARPPRLVQASDAHYLATPNALPSGSSTATYRGVASFMLDAVERTNHVRETVGVITPA